MAATRHYLCDAHEPPAGLLRRAAQTVQAGGLVGFPTETVYGIAARAAPATLQRLDRVKGRSPEKRYSLHVGSLEQARPYLPALAARVDVLLQRAWPGPLTVVLPVTDEHVDLQAQRLGPEVADLLYRDGTLGVRCPRHPVAEGLLSRVPGPVVAPSANPTGQAPAVSGDQVLRYFPEELDMILDAGTCPLGQSSTVVRIEGRRVAVLREGAVSEALLRRWMIHRILFVCTGNTCRSAMAEALARVRLAKMLGCEIDELSQKGYTFLSAGTLAADGAPASPEAIAVCAERGVDLTSHRSRPLTVSVLRDSDLIFVMQPSHRASVLDLCPELEDRCLLLSPEGLSDPFGGTLAVYRQCADQIEEAIAKRFQELVL